MKQNKTILILILLLLCTFLCSGYLYWLDREREDINTTEKVSITNISVGEVQAIALNNEEGSVGILNQANGVFIDGEDISKYSQSKLITLVYTLSHLKAERVLEDTGGEGDSYGFEQPLAQTSLLLKDEVVRLRLGRKSPIVNEYYLQIEGNSEVFMISEETAGLMLQSIYDLRDLSMYPILTTENLKKLSQVTLSNPKGKIVLKQLSNNSVSSFFAMTEPVATNLDWKNVDNVILNPIRELSPKHFISDNKPLSDYGLDQPEYTVELIIDGRTYLCGFAQKDQNYWYCANLSGRLVSEIEASAVAFLETDFMDLIGDSIYSVSMADLSRLTAKYEDKVVALELTGEASALTGTVGNRQMDYLEVTEFYSAIDSIPAAALYDDEELPSSSPILVLSMNLRNGEIDILEFYPVSERQCAVYVNGICEFTTYKTVVNDLKAAFDKLNQG